MLSFNVDFMDDRIHRNFYQAFFEQSGFGIMIVSAKGMIIDVNHVVCKWLNYSGDELTGRHLEDLVHPDDLRNNPPDLQSIVAGKTVTIERRLLKSQGGCKVVEVNAQKMDDEHIMVLFYDISQRKEELEQSEEQYRKIIETAQEGVWQMDRNHTTVFVNKRMATMLGYSPEEMWGRKVEDFFFEEDATFHEQRMKLRHQGIDEVYERRFRRKDGGECWTLASATALKDASGKFIGSFGFFTDITSRKNYEINLKISQERLMTLINASPDIICFKDADGHWMLANECLLKLYGLTGVDYVGKTEFELADFTAPLFQDAFRNCQGSDDGAWAGKTIFRIVETIPDTTGKLHIFDVIKVPLYHPDGSRKGLVVIGRDITEIKSTESALRESEEKYRQIAEYTSDVIWMINTDLKYTYVSPSIMLQRGFTQEEYLNLGLNDIYTPESLQKVRSIYLDGISQDQVGQLDHNFVVSVELQHNCKDGTIRDSDVRIRPILDANGKLTGAHGVSRDITEQKFIREKLRMLSEFQTHLLNINGLKEMHTLVSNAILEIIGDGIVISTDINYLTSMGRVMTIASKKLDMDQLESELGFNPVDLTFHLSEVTPDENKKYSSGQFEVVEGGLHAILLRRLPESISRKLESQYHVAKVYTVGYVHQGEHLGGLILLVPQSIELFADIITMMANQASVGLNRIRAELALNESEARFRLAFSTSPDSISINVLETGTFIEVNNGFTNFSGYTREEVIGKSTLDLHLWDNIDERTRLLENVKKDGSVTNMEVVFRTKDGTRLTGLISSTIFYLRGIPHLFSITRNIEDMKETQRDLIRAKEEAEEASRLKTAFLNNISHEVRTPMNAIIGFSELLQTEDFTPVERERYYNIVQSNANQLLSIIDDVLEVSRLDSGRIPLNKVQFSLNDLMEDIQISMNELVVRKGLHLWYKVDSGDENDFVVADMEKIRQVINGLIGNAVKFTREGSISFGCNKKENELELFVRDTGIGIATEHRQKIFERFFQVKHEPTAGVHGTGLGLSIARGLAEVMNGSIRVESTPGVGSAFILTIPYDKPFFPATDPETLHPLVLEDLTILVAEDEHFNYELIEILLEKHTRKLIRAVNGIEVIAILRKQKPDLILMDLKMPVMDGFEAARRAKIIYPDIRIIALTAYSQPEDASRAMQAGCNAFVSKPIRTQELFETIGRVLRT